MGIIYEYFSRKIFWEPFKIVSYGIFFLIIILYIFIPPAATIMLFAYIALWSRIPCMVSDYTKDLDMIDFFAVIISLNLETPLSGIIAGIFSVSIMMFSRLFGPDEDIVITITESIAFFAASVLTPGVFIVTNNLLLTMFIFTGIRYLVDFIIVLIFLKNLIWLAILSLIIGFPIAYIMNKTMIIFLGPFFKGVFQGGLKFHLGLFIIAIGLTVAAHFLPKFFKNKDIFDKPIKKEKRKKEKKFECTGDNVYDDNVKNYPEWFK